EGRSLTEAEESAKQLTTAPQKAAEQQDQQARFSLTITASTAKHYSWSVGPGVLDAGGVDLKTTLSWVYDLRKTRIFGPPSLEEGRYDIKAFMKEGNKNDLKTIIAKTLEASFGLKVRREMREMDVYVLVGSEQSSLKIRPSSSKS